MPALPYRRAWSIVRQIRPEAPLGTRLHVLGRFLTCPFLRVLEALPDQARVLDIGAGHRIFAHLAVAKGAARVVAVEPDRRKMLGERPAADGVLPVCGYIEAVDGLFDVVSMLDVLYRLPLSEWDGLLSALLGRLRPGGLLLLKEIDPTHRVKGLINRLQERLADAAHLTLGDAFSYEAPAELRERLERLGFIGVAVEGLGRGYPHAHVLYTARAPEAGC